MVSLTLFFTGYKTWYRALQKGQITSLNGYALAAAWAPLLRVGDTPDPQIRKILADGDSFGLRDIKLRDNQKYSDNYLCDLVEQKFGRKRAENLLKELAYNACAATH